MLDVFAIGNALVDQEYAVDDDFVGATNLQKGTMQLCDATQQAQLVEQLHHAQQNQHATHQGQSSGGSAANSIFAVAALGAKGFYACRVGQDALAQFYLKDLAQAGVQTSQQSLSTGQTGTCIVMVTPDAERTMYTHLGTSTELGQAQVDYTALAQAKWLYIEGYLATSPTAIQAVQQARQIAQQHGVKIALSLSDPAMVQYAQQGLAALIDDGVDMMFCNEQEALMYSQTECKEDAATALLQKAETVLITLGAAGVYIATKQQRLTVEGIDAKAIDSNGAGDAFAGAVLFALTQNQSLVQAAKLANHVAAAVVSQYGARLDASRYREILQQCSA